MTENATHVFKGGADKAIFAETEEVFNVDDAFRYNQAIAVMKISRKSISDPTRSHQGHTNYVTACRPRENAAFSFISMDPGVQILEFFSSSALRSKKSRRPLHPWPRPYSCGLVSPAITHR